MRRMANSHHRPWYKRDWPYWAGAIVLAIANTLMLAVYAQPWRITTALAGWWGAILESIGFSPISWSYYQIEGMKPTLSQWVAGYFGTWLVAGMVLGSFLSSTLAGQWRWRSMANRTMALLALIGGGLMGLGARLASGCNVGALASGIPSFSLHCYLFLLAVTAGAAVGAYLLRRWFA
ncbi:MULTISPECIES: YeeE/YedE thiosulfate transporter family protein [Carboxydocella]|uniref:YeeE/YedE thiosulfate transporter family protein n=1 Tax=Carboxydocella TaxID=178898 RepID=UPI00099A7FEB|nr:MULTISPECIES: YeeE/YedE thiosulfate transporter family protein [Carboxydocella]GAW31056.1 hypothetical protein JDF658_08210 [Carboxydocella sp. JDF658]